MNPPLIVAHRGIHSEHVENTLPAFRAAWDAGIDWCECDVRGSVEHEPFVIHDETVDRTFAGSGRVAEMTSAELKRVGVPTLDELLAAVPPAGRLLVEMKSPVSRELLARAIRACDARRCIVQSFDAAILRRAAEVLADLRLELLIDDASKPVSTGPWRAVNAGFESLTAGTVERLRDQGFSVGAWTVNTDGDIRRILALGVDTIISDEPLRVRDICGEIG